MVTRVIRVTGAGFARAVLVITALLVVAAAAIALVLVSRDEAPPEVLPNSLVRLDPDSLKPTESTRLPALPP
jgi:hypothetical protein